MESRGFQLLRACRVSPTSLFVSRACTTLRAFSTPATGHVENAHASEAPPGVSPTPQPSSSSSPSSPAPASLPLQDIPAPETIRLRKGTVISAGRMDRTVRVQYNQFMFHKHLNKTFPDKTVYMVADPNNSLRVGDVIEFSNGWRKSRNIRHVVERIIAPFGSRVEERPPILGREQREAKLQEKREEKLERKEKNGKKVSREPYVGKIKKLVQARMAEMTEDEKELLRNID
ncbi:hypothetical protein KEM56_006077 [Ascosphaera pollenicola]|nr:hypothetical protein KEM56_006077 [Ascosphaera pollenicola]